MAQLRVELHRHVPHPGPLESGSGPLHALGAVAHHIHGPGDKENGGVVVHFADVVLLADKADAGEHLPEQPRRGVALTQRVLQISVHVVRVQGQPIHACAVGGEAAVVNTEGGFCGHGAGPGLAVSQTFGVDDGQTGRRGCGAHVAGAHDNSAVHRAGIADEISPGQEGAHGVPQQEIGQVGELPVGQLPELLHVLHHPVPAALGTEVQPGRTVRD